MGHPLDNSLQDRFAGEADPNDVNEVIKREKARNDFLDAVGDRTVGGDRDSEKGQRKECDCACPKMGDISVITADYDDGIPPYMIKGGSLTIIAHQPL